MDPSTTVKRSRSFCAKIDKLTRTVFLVQILATGYNISLIGIKLAGSDPYKYKYLPLLSLSMGQLYICQWAPDYIAEESEAISTAAYFASANWIKQRIGKQLAVMIARAQKPVQMTAGGIVNLSLENFAMMLKNAFSFFAVLREFEI